MHPIQELKKLTRLPEIPVILLHFNVEDLVPSDKEAPGAGDPSLPEYLEALLADKEVVARYNPSSGLRFPNTRMRRQFLKCLNPTESLTPEQERELERVGVDSRDEVTLPKDPHIILEWLEEAMLAMQERGGMAIIFDHAETLFPEGDSSSNNRYDRVNTLTLKRWCVEREIRRSKSKVILLTTNLTSLHSSIRRLCRGPQTIEIPLPGFEERVAFLRRSAEGLSEDELADLARLSAGLGYRDLTTLLSMAGGDRSNLNRGLVWNWKKKLIADDSAGLVEVIQPRHGLEIIGGLEPVKDYFQEVIAALASGERNLVPMGITLMGPPGTGKTALVEALAHECGFACVRLVNVRDRWVGESERNYYRALQLIRALAPVVVLEDEADQSEQSRDEYVGDSGVSNRLRQMRFEFTSDPAIRGQVLWIRVTNRPDKLDIADKRSGRSSQRIPLCFPDLVEKQAILRALSAKHDLEVRLPDPKASLNRLQQRMGELISGADMEEILLRSYQHCRREGRTVIEEVDWEWAVDDFIPLSSTDWLRQLEEMAVAECSSRRFLPARYRNGTGTGTGKSAGPAGDQQFTGIAGGS